MKGKPFTEAGFFVFFPLLRCYFCLAQTWATLDFTVAFAGQPVL